jgi:hypothetical protein
VVFLNGVNNSARPYVVEKRGPDVVQVAQQSEETPAGLVVPQLYEARGKGAKGEGLIDSFRYKGDVCRTPCSKYWPMLFSRRHGP